MIKRLTILSAFKVFIKDPLLLFSLLANLINIAALKVRCLLTGKKIYYISLVESLGDIVATEPVTRHLLQEDKKRFLVWITQKPYKQVVAANPAVRSVITVTCLTQWIMLRSFIHKKKLADLHLSGKICNRHSYALVKPNPFDITPQNYFEKGNLLFAFSRSAGLTMDGHEQPKLYLHTRRPLAPAEAYIVIHSSSNMPVKTLNDSTWQEMIQYLLHQYPLTGIVEIGFERKYKGADKRVIDHTGTKDLEDIAGLIQHCSLFIGIDSGFAHFANALEKDSLILMGKYENFSGYMPYSGFFEREKEKMILYYPGYLKELSFDHIKERLTVKADHCL